MINITISCDFCGKDSGFTVSCSPGNLLNNYKVFKIQNNMIRFLKNPGCKKFHFSYKSNAVCLDGTTQQPKPQITANTDIPVFDEYLVKLGIIWRFNKRTGLDYTEEYNEYERELNKSYAETKAAGDIKLYSFNGIFDDGDGVLVNVNVEGKSCC
jgi:nucleoside-diphosphate-sugar epimerase